MTKTELEKLHDRMRKHIHAATQALAEFNTALARAEAALAKAEHTWLRASKEFQAHQRELARFAKKEYDRKKARKAAEPQPPKPRESFWKR